MKNKHAVILTVAVASQCDFENHSYRLCIFYVLTVLGRDHTINRSKIIRFPSFRHGLFLQ